MEEFAILMLLGVRVRETPNLRERAIWLPEYDLLVVDADLSLAERRVICGHALSELTETPAS